LEKIGFGGGCHWCTEAVFQSLTGVDQVRQGWIASEGEAFAFSEAVIVDYDPNVIPLEVLVEIHLNTHKSTSNHSMREKYRSALYFFENEQSQRIRNILNELQSKFEQKLITQILPYAGFKPSGDDIVDYYYKNPKKPFCDTFIKPKLRLLLSEFLLYTDTHKLDHLKRSNSETESEITTH